MVAHQILVLLAQVRILVGQQDAEWREKQKENPRISENDIWGFSLDAYADSSFVLFVLL